MNKATPAIQNLARRLIAIESARHPSEKEASATLRALDKLQAPLSKLVGVGGFRSLLSRALALAAVEVPNLKTIEIETDGSLKGFEDEKYDQVERSPRETGVAILTHLLGLLVTLIGEPFTLWIVRNAWPDALADQKQMAVEEQP